MHICRTDGKRLCTKTESEGQQTTDGGCCGSGCSFDNHPFWVHTDGIPPPPPDNGSDGEYDCLYFENVDIGENSETNDDTNLWMDTGLSLIHI